MTFETTAPIRNSKPTRISNQNLIKSNQYKNSDRNHAEDHDGVARPGPVDTDLPEFDLSTTKIVAGTAAAATAAFLGSGLGVAGTIVGAAIGSLISIIAAAIYTQTLARAQRRMRAALRVIPNGRSAAGVGRSRTSAPRDPVEPHPRGRQEPRSHPIAGFRPRTLFVGAAAAAIVFVSTLALITGVESVTGQPLSGGGGGGLTVLGGGSTGTPDRSDSDATHPEDGPDTHGDRTDTPSGSPTGTAGSSTDRSDDATTAGPTTPGPTQETAPGGGIDGSAGTTAPPSPSPSSSTGGTSSAPATTLPTGESDATPTPTDDADPTGSPTTGSPTSPGPVPTTASATGEDDGATVGPGTPVAPTG